MRMRARSTGTASPRSLPAPGGVWRPVRPFVPFCPSSSPGKPGQQLADAALAAGRSLQPVPELLFVCVHNAGRSQLAAALAKHLSGGRIHARSAGSTPAEEINPEVIQALAERGITLTDTQPKRLTDDVVHASDVIVTMGCGDSCPFYPGKRYLDWDIPDPHGQPIEVVRDIRDLIQARVTELLRDLKI